MSNALTGDYERFVFLQFDAVVIEFLGGDRLTLTRQRRDDRTVEIEVALNESRLLKHLATFSPAEDYRTRTVVRSRTKDRTGDPDPKPAKPVVPVSYLPAFRSMLDAWASAQRDGRLSPFERERTPTEFARRLFGSFVPQITYRSRLDIENRLKDQIRVARLATASAASEEMRQMTRTVFADVLGSVKQSVTPSAVVIDLLKRQADRIEAVGSLLGGTGHGQPSGLADLVTGLQGITPYKRLFLEVYAKAVERIADNQERATAQLKTYLDTINSFLTEDGKGLVISTDGNVRVRHAQGGLLLPLHTISSGE